MVVFENSYRKITDKLGQWQRSTESFRVIEGEVIDGASSELPITDALLDRAKGQTGLQLSSEVPELSYYRPKPPKSNLEKKFDAFLEALAKARGCTVDDLKAEGYSCKTMPDKTLKLNFPNPELQKSFNQFLKGEPLTKLLAEHKNEAEQQQEYEVTFRV